MADTINNNSDRHPQFLEQTPSDLLDVIIFINSNIPYHYSYRYNQASKKDQVVKDITKILAAREPDNKLMSMGTVWVIILFVIQFQTPKSTINLQAHQLARVHSARLS
jgi:hypothetical protein